MKGDNLKSLLKDLPQTQSYTPSAFLKGFVPAALLTSQSSSGSPKKSKTKELSPEAAAALKKTIHSMSYYRNPLPPEIKSINIKRSTRAKSIKMFKNKTDMIKGMEAMAPAGQAGGKKVMITDKIFRRDSLKTVQYLVGRNEQQAKERSTKGSMFVNELWSRGYEKFVLGATRLDADIKQVNLENNRPLGEKIEDLFKIYELKHQNTGTQDPMEDFNLHRSLTLQMPATAASSLRDNDQVLGLRMAKSLVVSPVVSPTTSPSASPKKTEEALSPSNTRRPQGRIGTSMGSVRLVPKGSFESHNLRDVQSTRVDSKESSPKRKQRGMTMMTLKSRLDDIESEKSLADVKDVRSVEDLCDSPCSIMKVPSSKESTATNFAINKQRWRQRQRGTSMEIQDGKVFGFGKSASPSPNTSMNISQNNFFKKLSMSFNKMPKETMTVSNLIMQCETQLGERGECLNMINGLKGKLRENKVFRDKGEDLAKQKLIGELRYMLFKRDTTEKGHRMRPNQLGNE